jgi:hypothetical protein
VSPVTLARPFYAPRLSPSTQAACLGSGPRPTRAQQLMGAPRPARRRGSVDADAAVPAIIQYIYFVSARATGQFRRAGAKFASQFLRN